MPIDPRIPMMAQAPELGEDFAQGYGRGQLMRQRALQEQAQRFELGQMQRAAQREQATEQALGAAGGDMQKALPSLMKIDPKLGMAISKELRSARTDQLNQAKLAMEQNLQNMEVQGRILSGIKDDQSYQNALVELDKLGIDISPLPNQFNAEAIQFYAKRGMSLKEQGEAAHRAIMEALAERGVKVQEANALRDAEAHKATLPGKIAESKLKGGEAEFVSKDPQRLTPGQRSQFDQSKAQFEARKAEAERAFKQREDFERGRQEDRRAGRAVQMRGQDMADRRAKEASDRAREGATQGAMKDLSMLDSAMAALGKLEKKVEENQWKMGPVAGRVGRIPILGGWASSWKKMESEMDAVRQQVGLAMEKGVLRDTDWEKYKLILPNITDTPDVARDKIARTQQKLREDIADYVTRQQQGGKGRGLSPQPSDHTPAPVGGKPKIDLRQFEGR